MSHVACKYFNFNFLDKVLNLVGRGSVLMGSTLSSLNSFVKKKNELELSRVFSLNLYP